MQQNRTLSPEQVDALERDDTLRDLAERGELVGRRLYAVARTPKPRCRVVQTPSGRVWVRFEAKPPQAIREAMKRQGAQFYRSHSAWLLPAGVH